MRKILMIVDSPDWAIAHLAKSIINRNPQFEWRFLAVHPKDLERGKVDLNPIIKDVEWADVIDFQYWRTCSQLMEMIPLLKGKVTVLTHQNDKDLFSADWSNITKIIARTNYAHKKLREKYGDKVELIPIGIDIDNFPYHGKDPEKPMVGYVGRIVPWKGLKEVAKACYELNYPLLVMGKMDKPSYFAEIPEEHKANIDFRYFECPDEDRIEAYREMTVYVGNSGDGRESGTMNYLEAMAVGVPVVTTPSGMAGDYARHYDNALVVPFYDYDALKDGIKELMENETMRNTLRANAWDTVRNFNWDRQAWQYEHVYYRAYYQDKDIVSVVIPTTTDRVDKVGNILKTLEESSYKAIEAVVVFDEEESLDLELAQTALEASTLSFPVKVGVTARAGYNLAMARNIGVIQAIGEFVMFCDSRMLPDKDAIKKFVDELTLKDSGKVWAFGEKGGGKDTFVENFSFIRRQDFIEAGMCNERITEYGGMSQELRTRFQRQGFKFPYLKDVTATQMIKSGSKNLDKRKQIIKMKNLLVRVGLY